MATIIIFLELYIFVITYKSFRFHTKISKMYIYIMHDLYILVTANYVFYTSIIYM